MVFQTPSERAVRRCQAYRNAGKAVIAFQTPSERAVRRWGAKCSHAETNLSVSNPFRAGGEALNAPFILCWEFPHQRFKPLQSGR